MDANLDNPVEHIISLLKPSELETQSQMAVQLAACTEAFGSVDTSNLLDGLFEREDAPYILALLVSSCRSETVSEWLLEQFPTDYYQELTYSAPFQALTMLSMTLISLMNVCPEIAPEVMQNHYLIASAPQILAEVLSFDSSVTTSGYVESTEAYKDEEKLDGIRIKPKSQTQGKRQRQRIAETVLSSLLLRQLSDLGLPIPVYHSDRENIAQRIMERLHRALMLVIHEFKQDAMTLAVKDLFFKRSFQPAPTLTTQPSASQVDEEQVSTSFTQAQHMKASLYFEGVAGFGQWRVQIAGRVEKQFREVRRAKPDQFKVIVKKIKELSRGHFTGENQIRLNKPHPQAVSIFEARADDAKIIYQIDCSLDSDTKIDTQVIKIFGIYTHSKLDEEFWDSVAVQLGSKSREYRYRCEFRSRARAKGDIFIPTTFAPMEGGLPTTEALPELPKENLQEIHSLLVLEKFVTFSQPLLNSILANVNVVLPFDITAEEKEIVQHPGSSFVIGRSGTGKTTSMMFKMLGIERAYTLKFTYLGVERPRQIFVTQSRVLTLKVQEYFKKLLESLSVASRSREELKQMQLNQSSQLQNEELVEQDEYELPGDLPSRFSLLLSEHFPLFISFDQASLCKLIEADVIGTSNTRPQPLVSYDIFFKSYWPLFPPHLTRALDPISVFSEFIGVIKGSEDALKTAKGFLDADTYKSLSYRTQPTFAHHRREVYELFTVYTKQKAARGEYDRADRTHRILRALKDRGIQALGTRIDFLYVDESQDNLLIDALLLRVICKNPNGYFFAGDTAQTISPGCSFRFNDLKALIYRAETQSDTHEAALPCSSPLSFQLTVNYRSHGGIVGAARSIVELIRRFFPYSIDNLAPESGVVAGEKPVFFHGFEYFSAGEFEQFFFGDEKSDIEFGAAQCILVRDKASQESLREKVGKIGQIMSEFDDVLLFNFFEESPLDLSLWGILLKEPSVNEFYHAGISSELKKLYVAITRARKNLWIVDHGDKSKPMRQIWASKDQIFCRTPADGVPRLAVSSSKERWAKQGLNLFQHKHYYQAQDCFERASLIKEAQVCHAYHLREEAQKFTSYTPDRKKLIAKNQAFVKAAEAFCHSAQQHEGKGKAQKTYLRTGAECYEAGEELELAAKTYLLVQEFNNAAKLYRRLEMFGPAVDIIRVHRRDMEEKVIDEITNVARLYYFTKQDLSKANALFNSHDEAITFLQDRDLDVAEAALLESLSKNIDAAQIHLNEGRVVQAVKLLFKDPADQQAIQLGVESLIPTLWKSVTFGMGWKRDDTHGRELLGMLDTVDLSLLEPGLKDEVIMFRAFARYPPTHPEFRRLGAVFSVTSKWTAGLLCFDSVFYNAPQIQEVTGSEAVEIIHDFLCYVRMLREAALHPSPHNEEEFQKLFGFIPQGSSQFLVSQDSILYTRIEFPKSTVPREHADGGVVVPGDVLCSTLKELLRIRLVNRIKLEHPACRRAQALDPCFSFTLKGYCRGLECKRQHVQATAAAELVATYRARVRLHMQQFLILQIWQLEDVQKKEASSYLDEWVGRLYQAMFPPHPLLGVLSDLDIKSIPEFSATLNLLRTISRGITYNIFPTPYSHTAPRLLTRFMQIAFYGFTYDPVEALAYIKRAACWNAPKPDRFIRAGNVFILGDIFSSHMTGPRALANGLWFILYIVKTKPCIDVGVFCDYIDRLVALFCATQKWDPPTPLHNLTLPRSWMLHLLQSHTHESLRRIAQEKHIYLRLLVDSLFYLAKDIHTRTYGKHSFYYLFYGDISLSRRGFLIASMFILRLFRAISYLAFNAILVDMPTRQAILRFFHYFGRVYHPSASPLFQHLNSYTSAQDWAGVVRLAQEAPFKADITFRLHHSSFRPDFFPGIQTIRFTTFDDTLSQVTLSLSSLETSLPDSELSKKQYSSIEQDLQPQAEANEGNHGTKEVEAGEENHDPTANNTEAEGEAPLEAVPPTEEEISAALKIQAAYRNWLHVKSQPSTRASYHAHFLDCLKAAEEITWTHGFYYKRLFLAGLPYILDTLAKLVNYVLSLKKETKKQLNASDTSRYEVINEKLKVLVNVLKEIKKIQRELQPKSDVHREGDLECLRKNVQMVWDIFHRKGWDHTLSNEYLEMGYIIIMDEKPLKKEFRPELDKEVVDEY